MSRSHRQLKDLSVDELEAELRRRRKKVVLPPDPLENPDFTSLREMVIEGVKDFDERGYEDEDFSHYVYEAAIEAVYGEEYWDWHNARAIRGQAE